MITLKPRNYKQNMKFSLLPKNKIDTVTMSPILNTVTSSNIFHTETITSVTIGNDTITLPSDSSDSANIATVLALSNTYYHALQNSGLYHLDHRELCKSGVHCVFVQGETIITTEQAVLGDVQAFVELTGFSYEIFRGSSSYDAYPVFNGGMLSGDGSLSTWVYNNGDAKSILTGSYNKLNLPFNGWIKNVVPMPESPVPVPYNSNVTATDVLTNWVDNSNTLTTSTALSGNWSDYSSTSLGGSSKPWTYMLPADRYFKDKYDPENNAIKFKDLSLQVNVRVERLSDYQYKVIWQAPIRFTYAAASRKHVLIQGYEDIDNYAYLDIMSAIRIKLQGTPLNTDQVDTAYSLDANNNLSTFISGKYPFDFEKNECITTTAELYPIELLNTFSTVRVGDVIAWQDLTQLTDWPVIDINDLPPTGFVCQELIHVDGATLGDLIMYNNEYAKIIGSGYNYAQGYAYDVVYLSVNSSIISEKGNVIEVQHTAISSDAENWSTYISKDLLLKYKNGKYIISVDVYADWAIINHITINTLLQVQLQDSTYIARDSSVCTFAVKTIEKRFSSNEFVYALKLMEV